MIEKPGLVPGFLLLGYWLVLSLNRALREVQKIPESKDQVSLQRSGKSFVKIPER
jgi:hypothetical protein